MHKRAKQTPRMGNSVLLLSFTLHPIGKQNGGCNYDFEYCCGWATWGGGGSNIRGYVSIVLVHICVDDGGGGGGTSMGTSVPTVIYIPYFCVPTSVARVANVEIFLGNSEVLQKASKFVLPSLAQKQ